MVKRVVKRKPKRKLKPAKRKPAKTPGSNRFTKTQAGPAPFRSIFNGIKAPKVNAKTGGKKK